MKHHLGHLPLPGNQNTDYIPLFRIKRNGRLQKTALVQTLMLVDIAFGGVQ